MSDKDRKEIKSKLKLNALGHSYNDMYFFIIPFLLPLFREEFSLSYVQSGLILTIHVALRSIFSLVFGYFGDKYEKKVIIACGFVCSSIFLGGLVWLNNIHTIVTFLFLLAIGVSTFHPLATAIVRENSKANQRGRYLSLFSAAGTAGIIVASLLFGFLVQIWGWKITCLLLSLPGYFLGYAYLKSKKDKKNLKTEAEKKTKPGYINLFFISMGIRSLGLWAILSFLPIYATDYLGLKPEVSAWIVSIIFMGTLIGSLISSRIIDKNHPLILVLSATIITTFLVLGITFIAQPLSIVLLIGTLGIVEGIFFPSQSTWLTFICPVIHQSKIFGISLFVEGFSATIAPTLYGWIADQSNLVWAYRLAAIPLFVSFILFLILHFLESKHDKAYKVKLNLST
ncbi:MFS transporter [bacterium]|nr:MFS transporter [bacterium]MBU4361114.1 MFS transporter [bacterium]MCG2762036.1 MFS transporter [Candidatus Atribacteria bacterium]